MRILIVGANGKGALENFYVKHLLPLCEIDFFPAHTMFYQYYYKSTANRIKYRLGISRILKQINRQLRNKVRDSKPDVILVFKGMEIYHSTLLELREWGIKLVNYNPDSPFFFAGSGSGNTNVKKGFPIYDLHITYSVEISRQINEHGHQSFVLPFAHDVDDDLYESCRSLSELKKACFTGTADTQRAEFLKQLLEKGIQIDIYGNGWTELLSHPNAGIFPAVYEQDFWKVLRRYRVQINLMRPHNFNSHNMRSFEVPGVGGIMVAPDTEEHLTFFSNSKGVSLFNNIDQCATAISTFLEEKDEIVAALRNEARRQTLENRHTYADRALTLYNELERLLS